MPALGGRKVVVVVGGGGANPGPVRWLCRYHVSPGAALPGAGAQRCLADHRTVLAVVLARRIALHSIESTAEQLPVLLLLVALLAELYLPPDLIAFLVNPGTLFL